MKKGSTASLVTLCKRCCLIQLLPTINALRFCVHTKYCGVVSKDEKRTNVISAGPISEYLARKVIGLSINTCTNGTPRSDLFLLRYPRQPYATGIKQ